MQGIMFKEPLYHQVVRGSKTETRRLVKFDENHEPKPSRYRVGDVLYLKEPYILDEDQDRFPFYAFDYLEETRGKFAWKNKMFMPAKLARRFIKITGVELRRLQQISVNDIKAEGVSVIDQNGTTNEVIQRYFAAWEALWNSINKEPFSWDDNPLVWVYQFEATASPVRGDFPRHLLTDEERLELKNGSWKI